MKNYQKIMQDFFSNFDISLDIFGKEEVKDIEKIKTLITNKTLTISNIRKNVNAVITLAESGMSQHYDGFRVDIVHKDNGKIVSEWFPFDTYLPHNCQIGNCKEKTVYSIIGYTQNDGWYGSAPKDCEVEKMVKAIMKYIGTWV